MALLFVAAVGIIWAAFLLPSGTRRGWPAGSVEDFGRKMELLAETGSTTQGRWIVTPRKGTPFIGPTARAQARARERRRRVFVFLLEAMGLTFLIGLVPPFHAMWYSTALLFVLLGGYVWLLLALKEQSVQTRVRQRVQDAKAPARPRPVRHRYVSEGLVARPVFNGLGALDADDLVHIVVRPAREVGVAGV